VRCVVIRCRLEAGNRPRNEVVRLTKPVNLKPKSIHESEASITSLSLPLSLCLSLSVSVFVCLSLSIHVCLSLSILACLSV